MYRALIRFSSLTIVVMAVAGCSVEQSPLEWQDEAALIPADEVRFLKTKADGGTNGDFNYCNDPSATCDAGEGDCDNDSHCSDLLVCGQNNGGNYGFASNLDVCWPTHCENGTLDGDETSVDFGGSCSDSNCPPADSVNGSANGYCTETCPCDVGFGDCDNDTHCEADLICLNNNGSFWGMPFTYDTCVGNHCNNGTLDGDETDIDEGGSCGSPGGCLQELFYADTDGDGYGDATSTGGGCEGAPPGGFVSNAEDCDDSDGSVNPDGTETCNDIDDDCNGLIDDGVGSLSTFYADADSDSFGDDSNSLQGCTAPPGYVDDNTDCDDGNGSVNPDASEVCNNGADDNCDGLANGCRLTGTVDTFASGYAMYTGATDDAVGYTLSAGDLNGDGVNELAIGAPVIPWRLSPGQPGSVYLMYGPVPAGTSEITSVADATFVGEDNQDHAGLGLAIHGDMDQDGNGDVAIGAPDHAQATTGGRVYFFYGTASRFSGSIDMSSASFTVDGNAPEMWLGASIDFGGDISGLTSFPDLSFGAPGDMNDGAGGGTGHAYSIRGASSQKSGALVASSNANLRITGPSADSGFGTDVVNVGHVGGGNRGDYAVGSPGRYWWTGDANAGEVYVFFGQASGGKAASSADVIITGVDTDHWLGVSIAGAADLDGDGVNELICGASGDSDIATNAGRIAVFRGPLSGTLTINDADISILGDTDFTYVGEGVSTGDFDNDGATDLVVSSWSDGGYLWYGNITDGTYSMNSADLLIGAASAADELNLGSPTQFVGDVTGDGVDDIAIADVGWGSSAGAVYILEGSSF